MGTSNLKINGSCIQCGSCLGCGYSFLQTADDGTIVVLAGTILEENGKEIAALKEICPVNAFEITSTESKDKVLKNLIEELKKYNGIKKPTESDFKFDQNSYSISIPSASGENRYEYSSSNAAESAALREFERVMYSRIDTIILKVISEYRVKMVKPYYSSEEIDGSVYAINNKKVSEILSGIKNILGNKLPADFATINVMPDRDDTWKMLNKGQLISDELISAVRHEFDYPSSQYDCYWDWDDMEVYEGTDWRGRDKYKDKYCYRDIYKAFRELAQDLLNACGWAHDDLESCATRHAEWLVEVYNRELDKVIKEKIQQIENAK